MRLSALDRAEWQDSLAHTSQGTTCKKKLKAVDT